MQKESQGRGLCRRVLKARWKKVRGEILAHQEKQNLPEKWHAHWSGKVAKGGVEETNGGCGRKERNRCRSHFFMEVNQPGSGGRTVHDGHAGLGGRNLDGKMGNRAAGGLEEADFRGGAGLEASEKDLQEPLCARPVIWASSGHSGTH